MGNRSVEIDELSATDLPGPAIEWEEGEEEGEEYPPAGPWEEEPDIPEE